MNVTVIKREFETVKSVLTEMWMLLAEPIRSTVQLNQIEEGICFRKFISVVLECPIHIIDNQQF